MRMCSFCGASAEVKAGRLALCRNCRAALCAVKPGEARYMWFQGAVRRALFEAVAPRVGPQRRGATPARPIEKNAAVQPAVDKTTQNKPARSLKTTGQRRYNQGEGRDSI